MARHYKRKDNRILIVYWDTETVGFGGVSLSSQFCYSYGEDDKNEAEIFEGFTCIEETFQAIKQIWLNLNKPTIRLYAHNAAFDLMRVKGQVEGSVFKSVLVSGQLIAGKLLYDGMVFECRDSLRLLPESLAKLSKSLAPDLPKLQMNHLQGYEIGNVEDQEYAKRDVITLRAILKAFSIVAEIPLEKLKFSAAGQAFTLAKRTYENEFGTYNAITRAWNETFLKYYYFGGRIYIRHNHNPLEIFTAVSLDITSSYPVQMLNQFFPLPGKVPKVLSYIPNQKGRFFVKMKVKDYNDLLPICPYRTFNDKGEKTASFYPNGNFITHLTDIEYDYLKKYSPNTIKNAEIMEVLFWKHSDCAQWLKTYIEKYYKLKQLGDELNAKNPGSGDALRTVAKLFLNAVYGKFAQKYIDNGGEQVGWGKGNEVLEIFGESTNDHRNAHVSAFITGGARVYLYEAIQHYGVENVVYCDTDSVKILEHIYNTYPKMKLEGDYLGSWKPEGTYHDLQVIAPKVYIGTHDGKLEIKAKGLPVKGITAIQHGKDYTTFKRSNVSEEKNISLDAQACKLIADTARSLIPILVSYEAKPTKLKTFLRTGTMASKTVKTMSYPDKVQGMNFDGIVYKNKNVME